MLYGLDVHVRYQAGLNIEILPGQGYTFLATKASQGVEVPSVGITAAQFTSRMLAWVDRTRTAGMTPGLYHWVNNAAGGAAQARFFHALVVKAGGPEGMLIQLDNEDNATWEITRDWAAEWEQLTGGHPWLMYTGGWWWRPRGWNGASLTPYLWDSHYLTADLDTAPDDPAAFAARIPADWWNPGYGNWPSATFLQFTSRGDAGGLGNNVDLNATKLTMPQLLTLTGSQPTPRMVDTMRFAFKGLPNMPPDLDGRHHITDGLRYRVQVSSSYLPKLYDQAGAGPLVTITTASQPTGKDYPWWVAQLCGSHDPGESEGDVLEAVPVTFNVALTGTATPAEQLMS